MYTQLIALPITAHGKTQLFPLLASCELSDRADYLKRHPAEFWERVEIIDYLLKN